MTASTAIQLSYEHDPTEIFKAGVERPALFTGAIVNGLESGEADLDGDGTVSMGELYDYVHGRLKELGPEQTPTLFSSQAQGTMRVAWNPRGAARAHAAALSELRLQRRLDEEFHFSFAVPSEWVKVSGE